MFDEYIEHAGNPQPGFRSPNRLDMEFEGFQQDDRSEDGLDGEIEGMEAMETGYFAGATTSASVTDPLFSLSLVQFSLPSALLSLDVNSNVMAMAVSPLSLIVLDLNRPTELINIDLPRPASGKEGRGTPDVQGPKIDKIFGDPTGKHLLVTTTGGDCFYAPTSGIAKGATGKARNLRLKSAVTCVAWATPSSASTPGTTECLLGGPSGSIHTLTLPPSEDIFKAVAKTTERDYALVYTLPGNEAITGLGFGFWTAGSRGERTAWVVVSTKDRLYEMQGAVSSASVSGGKGGWAEEVFRGYRNSNLKFQDLPGDLSTSQMRFHASIDKDSKATSLTDAVAWLSGPGLYCSPIPTSIPAGTSPGAQPVFAAASLISWPAGADKKQEAPTAIMLTDHHYVVLFAQRIVGISRVTERLAWEERVPLKSGEQALGLAADPVNRTYWLYTNQAMHEIIPQHEDRDVWKGQLEKGNFEVALGFVKTPQQRDMVLSKQADNLFDTGKYLVAAQTYAKTSRSFEYVTLRFVDAEERDGLRVYLSDRLHNLDKTRFTERMMLATWLVEIYLSKCNTLEDIIAAEAATSDVGSLKVELGMMEDDLRDFLTRYRSDLDRKVLYELIQSHGKTDVYLFYAGLVREHDRVVQYWIDEGKYTQAIDVLNRQESTDLYYRFAAVLMRNAPKETADSWLRQTALEPRRLIPAMLSQRGSRGGPQSESVVRYLRTVIERGSVDHTIHNLLVTILAGGSEEDAATLVQFLSGCVDDPLTGKPYYDLDYALRTCKQHNRIQACVHIYSKMGLYENSVDLALEKGDIELAKINADKPEDDDALRKRLWLKIAKHEVVQRNDIKEAMKLLESTELLKIEDLLPFFPDFVVVDDFKDEICAALEGYSAHIESLREEMDQATKSAANITAEIDNLRNRFITIDASDRCSHCNLLLMTRQFYVFPCQHLFHADCLITLAKDFLPPSSLRRIIHLQTELLRASGAQIRSNGQAGGRQLLSATDANGDGDASRKGTTSQNDTTALLLGVTGRNKLFAAGDKLRDLIVPDMLASAVSVVGAGMGAGLGISGGSSRRKTKETTVDEAKMDALRRELDGLVAASCAICEGSVAMIDKPFVMPNERDDSWDV